MAPEEIEYPYPKGGNKNELKDVLRKTLGVPLFQEQAMRIAMAAAEFTPEEANGLRRAMATFRNVGTMPKFQRRMVDRMIARGYDPCSRTVVFDQIKGFGSYGFPESHAASFAQLVYVSSWIKHYHPDVFCCGLLNSQPMGFYAPAQIVGDARKNGVDVREIDVSHSFGQNTLGRKSGTRSHCAVRLGFRQIDGFEVYDPDEESWMRASRGIESQKKLQGLLGSADRRCAGRKPFSSLEDFARETGLPKR
jgi:error-prone DNA polymerase